MAGISIGSTRPYFDPTSGITGTAEQHAAAIRRKQEEEQRAQQQREFQQQQQQASTQTANEAARGYAAGYPSAGAAGQAARTASSTSQLTGAGYSVDPQGYVSFDDSAAQARRTAAEADARRLAALRSLMKQYGGADRDAAPVLPISRDARQCDYERDRCGSL